MQDFKSLSSDEQNKRLHKLATEALESWNIRNAKIEEIKIRENAVYCIELEGGKKFALRIHRGGYHANQNLNSEFLWMEKLSEHGIETPKCVALESGENFIVLNRDYLDEPRQVDLFEWVDGNALGTTEGSSELSEDELESTYNMIGGLAAQIHNQSSSWKVPTDFSRHSWDAEGLAGETPFWGRYWELAALSSDQRKLITRARTAIYEDLIILFAEA